MANKLIKGIQGLRAIMLIVVVLYHAEFAAVRGGYVGVDVFFVISGFLITGILVRQLERTGRVSFAEFYARRIRRLLPGAALVVVVTVVASRIIYAPARWALVGWDGVAAMVSAANLRFFETQSNYLATGAAPSPLLHYWSLAVEEQFYLVWPAIIALAWHFGRKRAAIATMVVLTLASFLLSATVTSTNQPFTFYLLPARAWEFGAGALLALLSTRLTRLRPGVTVPLTVGGLSLIAYAVFTYDTTTVFPGWAAALPVLGAVMVIAGSLSGRNAFSPVLENPVMQYLGKTSYSVYLWHWPIFVLAAGYGASRPNRLALLAASFVAGALSFHFVENPMRLNRRLAASPRRGIGFAGVTVALSVMVSLVVLPAQATTNPGGDPCELGFDVVTAGPCESGSLESNRTIVVFGDSHANQWTPALEILAKTYDYRLVRLTKSACPAAHVKVNRPNTVNEFTECETWRTRTIDRINTIERPEIVVLASKSKYNNDRSVSMYEQMWRVGYVKTLKELAAPGRRLVVVNDTPYPGVDIPGCLAKQGASSSNCDLSRKRSVSRHDLLQVITEAANDYDAIVVDPVDWLCPTERCPAVIDGIVVYMDESHISPEMSRFLEGRLGQAIGVFTDEK